MDPMLTIKAGAYSFEAANPRHDHEWRVARKFRVPEGKILIPGRPYPTPANQNPRTLDWRRGCPLRL